MLEKITLKSPSFEQLSSFFTLDEKTLQLSNVDQVVNKFTPLLFSLAEPQGHIELDQEQWDYLIYKSNLKTNFDNCYSALFLAITSPNPSFSLSYEYLEAFIQQSNVTFIDDEGSNDLLNVLDYLQERNLNVTIPQLDYLLKNSDLSIINKRSQTALTAMLKGFNNTDLLYLLPREIWEYVFKNSDLNVSTYEETNFTTIPKLIEAIQDPNSKDFFFNMYEKYINKKIHIIDNKKVRIFSW